MANVSTLVVLTKNGPLILMIASKEISYGAELLYNYNAYVKMYNTDDFVWLLTSRFAMKNLIN